MFLKKGPLKGPLFFLFIAGLMLPALNAMAEPALPFKSEEPDFPMQGQIAIIVLGFALLLLFCFLGWRRRRGNVQGARWLNWLPVQQSEDGLKILSSKRIAGSTSVHVVEWDGGKVLLAIGEQGVVRLGEIQASAHADKSQGSTGEAS